MDMDARQLEDQERFAAFRARMRANVEQTMADYMERAKPVTSAEVRSHFQTIAVADRTLRQLCDLPARPRARAAAETKADISRTPKPKRPASPPDSAMLRELQVISRLLDKTDNTNDIDDEPDSSPPYAQHGEVAREVAPEGSAPAAAPAPPPEEKPALEPEPQADPPPEPSPQQQLEAVVAKADDKLDQITYRCAQWAQIWPDGTLFEDSGSDWRAHVAGQPLEIDLNGDTDDHSRLLAVEALRRCNAIARQAARFVGIWFDDSPYCESDPDFWSLSANFGSGVNQPADFEAPSPACLPWWIIKKRPT